MSEWTMVRWKQGGMLGNMVAAPGSADFFGKKGEKTFFSLFILPSIFMRIADSLE